LSIEYLPGPIIIKEINNSKYKSDFSFFENGSPSCTNTKATNIVTIGKMQKNRVFHPIMIKIGTMNSAKAVNISEGKGPIPIGSLNVKSPLKIFRTLPYP
tara:strand:+ start:306 stop:605 length:300 start_codon:yes stop_codon:yes gene_type:complete